MTSQKLACRSFGHVSEPIPVDVAFSWSNAIKLLNNDDFLEMVV